MADMQFTGDRMKKRKFGLLNAGMFNKIIFPGRTYLDQNMNPVDMTMYTPGSIGSADNYNTTDIHFTGELSDLYADSDTFFVDDQGRLVMRKRIRNEDGVILRTNEFVVGTINLDVMATTETFKKIYVSNQQLDERVSGAMQNVLLELENKITTVNTLTAEEKEELKNSVNTISESVRQSGEGTLASVRQQLLELETQLDTKYSKTDEVRRIADQAAAQVQELRRYGDLRYQDSESLGTFMNELSRYVKKAELADELEQLLEDIGKGYITRTDAEVMIRNGVGNGFGATEEQVLRGLETLETQISQVYVKDTGFNDRVTDLVMSVGTAEFATRNTIRDLEIKIEEFSESQNGRIDGIRINLTNLAEDTATDIKNIGEFLGQLPSAAQINMAVAAADTYGSTSSGGLLESTKAYVDALIQDDTLLTTQTAPLRTRATNLESTINTILTTVFGKSAVTFMGTDDSPVDASSLDISTDIYKAASDSDLTALQSTVTTLSNSFNAYDREVALISTDVETNKGAITGVKARLDTLEANEDSYVNKNSASDLQLIADKVPAGGNVTASDVANSSEVLSKLEDERKKMARIMYTGGSAADMTSQRLLPYLDNVRGFPVLMHNVRVRIVSGDVVLEDPIKGQRIGVSAVTTLSSSGISPDTENNYVTNLASRMDSQETTAMSTRDRGQTNVMDSFMVAGLYKNDVYFCINTNYLSIDENKNVIIQISENAKSAASGNSSGSKTGRMKNRIYSVETLKDYTTDYSKPVYRIDAFSSGGTTRPDAIDIDLTVMQYVTDLGLPDFISTSATDLSATGLVL